MTSKAVHDGDSNLSYINDYISCMSNKSVNFREYDIYSFGSIVYAFFAERGLMASNYDSLNRKESHCFLEELCVHDKHTPELIKDIIRACWEEDFQKRPLFVEICYLFIEYFKQLELN